MNGCQQHDKQPDIREALWHIEDSMDDPALSEETRKQAHEYIAKMRAKYPHLLRRQGTSNG